MKVYLQIKEVPFGIACRIGRVIYIHKELKGFSKKLYRAILKHEREHSDGLNYKDFILDINNNHLKGLKKEYYNFIFKYPSSLIELLPCWKYDGELIWNITLVIFYLTIGGILWTLGFFLKSFY